MKIEVRKIESVSIDDMLAGSATGVNNPVATPEGMQQYQDYFNSDQFKADQIKALAENYKDQKSLTQRRFEILRNLSDPLKQDKLFKFVSVVHGCILGKTADFIILDDCIQESMKTDEDLNFMLANKHSKFYRTTDVMDEFQLNPVQKELVKRRHYGRRLVKKQKTPMQHFNTLIDAKGKLNRDQRLEALENSMLETRQALALLANNQVELQQQLGTVQKDLATLQETVKDLRKLKLYVLISNSKKTTNGKLAESLDVSIATIKRWKKELKDEGYL